MSAVPKRLSGPEVVLAFMPDIICLYRALATVCALLAGRHPAAPWLFSTALVSDLLDGWLYRHYTKYHPWLSRRPYLPCDPLADLTLILTGTVYAARYWMELDWVGVIYVLAVVVVIAAILHIIPYIGPPNDMVYTVCTTFMVHISCFMMLATTVIVWRVNTASWYYPISTLAVFYAIFFLIGDKTRLVRRPPNGWRAGK